MFKKNILCKFFSLGQCLPTHRAAHSPYGGPFQPTVTQAIRLLSTQPQRPECPEVRTSAETSIQDPFSDPSISTYKSSPLDPYPYPNPSYYQSRRLAWVHVFPEGRIHQHPDRLVRYFKWGVARLILESDPAPTLVPLWIEGFENVMHESREFPRFLPRLGRDVTVTFGARVETDEGVFQSLRKKWRDLVAEETKLAEKAFRKQQAASSVDHLLSEQLKYGAKAVKLREECTLRVRDEVIKLRRQRGYPDEDRKAELADTWREEGSRLRDGKMEDGSWVRDA